MAAAINLATRAPLPAPAAAAARPPASTAAAAAAATAPTSSRLLLHGGGGGGDSRSNKLAARRTTASAAPAEAVLGPTPDSLFRMPEGAPMDDRRDQSSAGGRRATSSSPPSASASAAAAGEWSLPAELPRPAAYQQTIARSFTLGGIGLHTGRFHTVRLRPARAGEGRYFVRVPAGTNAGRWDPARAAQAEALAESMLIDAENPADAGAADAAAAREEVRKRAAALRAVAGGADDPETERRRAELFREWRDAVENGLAGGPDEDSAAGDGFEAWVRAREREEIEEGKALAAAAAASPPPAAAASAAAAAAGLPLEDGDIVARPAVADSSSVIEASIRAVYVISAAPCVQLHASDPSSAAEAGGAVVESVLAPERLLAALEACGVDNCRVEIEAAAEDEQEGGADDGRRATDGGGGAPPAADPLAAALEVPVLDGSALGWCLWLQSVGLRPAPVPQEALARAAKDKDGGGLALPRLADGTPVAPRGVLAPREPVTVRAPAGQDAHATLVPALFPRYTAGVDRSAVAPVIGTQWHSWAYARGDHFRYDLAPARMYSASRDELQAMRRRGLLKGGGEGVVLVAHGRRWWDSAQVRFPLDEAARSDAVDLVGTLALLGVAGHGGLPAGHAVAFNADPALRLALAREVLAACARAAEQDGGGAPASWEDMLVSYASVLAAQAGEVDAAAAAAAQRSVAAGLRDSAQL